MFWFADVVWPAIKRKHCGEAAWWKIRERNKWRVGELCQHITNIRNGLVFT